MKLSQFYIFWQWMVHINEKSNQIDTENKQSNREHTEK